MSDKMEDKLFTYKFRLALREVVRSLSSLHRLAKQNGLKPDLTNVIHHYGKVTNTYMGYRINALESIPAMFKDISQDKPSRSSRVDLKKMSSMKYFAAEVSNKIGKYVSYNVAASNDYSKCGVTLNKFGNVEKVTIHTMHENHAKIIGSLGSNKVLVYAIPHKHDKFSCWKSCYLSYKYINGERKLRIVDSFVMKDQSSGIVYYHTDYRLCADGMRRAIGRKIASRIGG